MSVGELNAALCTDIHVHTWVMVMVLTFKGSTVRLLLPVAWVIILLCWCVSPISSRSSPSCLNPPNWVVWPCPQLVPSTGVAEGVGQHNDAFDEPRSLPAGVWWVEGMV